MLPPTSDFAPPQTILQAILSFRLGLSSCPEVRAWPTCLASKLRHPTGRSWEAGQPACTHQEPVTHPPPRSLVALSFPLQSLALNTLLHRLTLPILVWDLFTFLEGLQILASVSSLVKREGWSWGNQHPTGPALELLTRSDQNGVAESAAMAKGYVCVSQFTGRAGGPSWGSGSDLPSSRPWVPELTICLRGRLCKVAMWGQGGARRQAQL